ncbi:MAG: hypothetical protein IJZ57_10790 [Clostridia bacterium]|nr:hypothetical protein [Clostridia bacterium]
MKTFILKTMCLFLICAVVLFSFSSCSLSSGIEVSSCELIKASDGIKGIFTILNNENKTIDELKITVKAFDKNKEEIDSCEAEYALYIDPDHEATITVSLPEETETATAVAYKYTVDGKEKSGEFKENNIAAFPEITTADTKIDTREELAEMLIEDIEHQFMLQQYEAHGYYDKENKQVIIASYATKTYDECYYAYSLDPTIYNDLEKSLEQMSLTCYEEFQNYNFKDVEVSVGFLSSDEKIMISATNGTIVDNFS